MAGVDLKLKCDAAPVTALLEELGNLLREVGDVPFDVAEALNEPCRIEVDSGAAGAGEIVVRLEPSDGLLGLAAALRARNGDLGIIKHSGSPAGVDSGRVTEGGEGGESSGIRLPTSPPEGLAGPAQNERGAM